MCGNSAYDWNTMLTSRSLAARSVTSLPPIRTRPPVTGSSPATMRSVVVLPQPEGPSSVHELALRDRERDVVDGGDVAVALGDAVEDDAA